MSCCTFDQTIAKELVETAQKLCSPGKGILASDESTGTIQKRFDAAGIDNTEVNRATYRSLLYTTPDIGNYISGAIMYEETLFQTNSEGVKMTELCKKAGVIPGIKVDLGVETLPLTNQETVTMGLDGLSARCKKYYEAGARFTKWRAVLKIDQFSPSELAIEENARTLARYASICQANRLVPIVEPEILTDGTHDIETCAYYTEKVLSACMKALNDHHVLLEGCLLKPNMVTPGVNCKTRCTPAEIAYYTLRTLQRTVPPSLAGVTFLSGGQSEEEATLNLDAMNKMESTKKP